MNATDNQPKGKEMTVIANGTEKQIEWATKLRDAMVKNCRHQLEEVRFWAENELRGEDDQTYIDQVNARVACWESRLKYAENLTDATSIINTRNHSWSDGHDQYGWPL